MRIYSVLLPVLLAAVLPGCSDATKKTPPPVVATALSAPSSPPMPVPLSPPATAAEAPAPLLPEQVKAAFITDSAKNFGLGTAEIEGWLAQAKYRQSIVDAMSRPAESVKPWKDYRTIFLTDARIQQGRAFYAQNREQLLKVQAQTGVPAEYIVAIIGVETS